ncbi:hypothetical protein [Rhodococcus qingshengii]|uniref:MmyB family transcriptional regulator n=1 Tax=Rhodococcus qingshengii TaxID=334542 RepID=UPI0030196E5D
MHFRRTVFKKFHPPVVGDLGLNFEAMDLLSNPGLALLVYTVAPDTPTVDALKLLASWAAAQDLVDPVARTVNSR